MGESQREESVWKKLGKRKVKGGKDNKKSARTYKVAGLIKKYARSVSIAELLKPPFCYRELQILFFSLD